MTDRIIVEIAEHVADVRLNRPDKINALDAAMFDALVATGARLATEPGVRAVVLSGEGRGFCAGLDFAAFQTMAEGSGDDGAKAPGRGGNRITDTEGRITHRGQQAAWTWQELPVPVIAAVHGVALGGGLQVALGADLRIVAPDARLSVLEIRWGLTPDMTATETLLRLVGLDVAKELLWTGRIVDGTEAVELGLATRVADDPRAAALDLARDLASRSPDAVRAGKRLLNAANRRALAEAFAAERAEIGTLIGSPNQVEAVRAWFEKRPPDFTDP